MTGFDNAYNVYINDAQNAHCDIEKCAECIIMTPTFFSMPATTEGFT